MKRFLSIAFVIIGMATASLFSGCNKGSSPVSYPDIVTVNTLLPGGTWELIKIYDPQIGEKSGNGTIYSFTSLAIEKDDYAGGVMYIQGGEQLPHSTDYYLEPILQGDLDGSDSQLTAAVEISGEGTHYMISVLSETTMKWQKIDFENGKVVLKSGYLVFSRRYDIN